MLKSRTLAAAVAALALLPGPAQAQDEPASEPTPEEPASEPTPDCSPHGPQYVWNGEACYWDMDADRPPLPADPPSLECDEGFIETARTENSITCEAPPDKAVPPPPDTTVPPAPVPPVPPGGTDEHCAYLGADYYDPDAGGPGVPGCVLLAQVDQAICTESFGDGYRAIGGVCHEIACYGVFVEHVCDNDLTACPDYYQTQVWPDDPMRYVHCYRFCHPEDGYTLLPNGDCYSCPDPGTEPHVVGNSFGCVYRCPDGELPQPVDDDYDWNDQWERWAGGDAATSVHLHGRIYACLGQIRAAGPELATAAQAHTGDQTPIGFRAADR